MKGYDNGGVPKETLEALARTFFQDAAGYGFTSIDFVRYVNVLLDVAMAGMAAGPPPKAAGTEVPRPGAPSARLPLSTGRLTIRCFDPAGDLAVMRRWLRDKTGRLYLLSRTTAREHSFEEVLEDERNLVAMITLPDGRPVGSVAYLDLDPLQRKAELRKLIGEPALRGRGYAKEATRAWVDYGIQALGLRKIYLNTLHTNIRNVKLNEDLGFKVEGILRNELYFDGRYHDVLRMGLWAGPDSA